MQENIAKITFPKIDGVFPRERLFRLIDKGRNKPLTWISAPAGSGKTTLAASYLNSRKLPCFWYRVDEVDADIATFFYYMSLAVKMVDPGNKKPLPLLTPEYHQNIPIFARRYFEDLYSRLKPPWIIVFDNVQDVSVNSLFHKALTLGLDIIPDNINMIAISRDEPPSHYARICVNNECCHIGRDEVGFTMEESKEILQTWVKKRITNKSLLQLHAQTQGWAAGLVLIAEHVKTKGIDYTLQNGLIHEKIFDYFANEIFEKTDKETQTFLLQTAFFPRMSIKMAEKLPDISKSAHILYELCRKNYFTTALYQTEPIYQYHPLFREFLCAKARGSFDSEILFSIQSKVATLLEESSQPEDAALLFKNIGDWNSLVRLTCSHASSFMEQGRTETLKEWITNIPENIRGNEPWILYWQGLCTLPYNSTESRSYFDMAFEQFRVKNEPTGMWLSWAYAVDTIFHEFEDFSQLDNYDSLFESMSQKGVGFPSREVELRAIHCKFFIMSMREPNHPEIEKLAYSTFLSLLECRDLNLCMQLGSHLVVHYLWMGDFANVDIVINSFKEMSASETILPLERLLFENTKGMYTWLTGSIESCHRGVSDALKLARDTGIHLWDNHLFSFSACAALSDGDLETATEMIRNIEANLACARKIDIIFYRLLCIWRDLTCGDLSSASKHMEINTGLVEKLGAYLPAAVNHVAAAHVFTGNGEHREAMARLNRAQQIEQRTKSKFIKYMRLMTKAYILLEQSEKYASDKNCMDVLRQAMSFGREHRFLNCFFWRPEIISRLCIKALKSGIESEYVRELIRVRKLVPDTPTLECEEWPWPLKIFTLGRFAMQKDESPVLMSKKVQGKPLELIKTIVSLGSKEVSISQVTDILWPDTVGDVAHHAFETTLYRLRRLVGNEKAIRLQGGLLSLDKRYCWVDVWAFERLLEKINDVTVSARPAPIHHADISGLVEEALDLYKGSFLPTDSSCLWTVSFRKSLQKKFFRLVMLSGSYFESTKQWQTASEYYERAIEIDPLIEEFYQRLMICHQMLGERLEAVKVYHHLRDVLSASFQIKPSQETETICNSILTEQNKAEGKIL